MKKNKQNTDAIQTRVPQFGRLTLLVGALVASGVLSPLSMPAAVAAPLPVPVGMPCGGCSPAANMPAGLNFVQYVQPGGSVTTSLDNNGTTLTINQDSQVAILNWQQFNIDQGHSVNFVQPNSTSSALNRIWDANPTTIAGSLTANGQIYLINQNGIVFGNGAQVNTNTLIATSLDIKDQLFKDGYLTNVLNKGVIPAFSGEGGFVKVETGAVLNGSRVMMFAPVVENNGIISTPGGQTVMAAGNKVYLEASQDPNLRGVLVEVDVTNPGVADPLLAGRGLQHTEGGVVSNAGDIISERGNITLVGFAVNQQGRISATTSVTENGSIKLLARYGVETASSTVINDNTNPVSYDIRATKTGKVTLASDSVTQVVPELVDTSTTTDGQDFASSIVEVMGSTIDMQSGSKIVVPGGKVTLAAISSYDLLQQSGLNPTTGLIYQKISSTPGSSFINPNYVPVSSVGDQARVFMDSGSLIDVSGSSASVSVARNILAVQLRGSQLADSPVQRTDRFLWGKDVLVDIREGTSLASYAAEEAQIGRTVAERTAAGGSVKLVSTGDVVMKSGSTVDISGGQVKYDGANISATTLVSEGVVYDIADASPDRIYSGISNTYTVDHKKWGIKETFSTMAGGDSRGRWDAGYVEGKSAGTLTILAPHAVIDGEIIAKTVSGIYQRDAFVETPIDPATGEKKVIPYKDTWKMMAQGGSLVIGNENAKADESGITNYTNDSNVKIHNGATPLANDFTLFDPLGDSVNALPTSFMQGIVLNADLFGSSTGVNKLAVYSNKTISLTEGTALKLAAGGSIILQGDTVNMLGVIDAPSATVKLGTAATDSSVGGLAGALNVGVADGSSYISTRGQWVNDSVQFGVPDWSKSLSINGGSINLSSGGDLLLASGTKLDASGGAWLDASNKYHGGNGGAITLKSGKATGVAFRTQLEGVDLRSYGTAGGDGGSLTIAANDVVLGGADNANSTTLVLPAAFFQKGGFTGYNVTAQGFGGLLVSAGTVIEPKAQSLILGRSASGEASAADVSAFAQVGYLPDWQRKATSITLDANNNGTLKVAEGAVIRVEPTGSIKLSASSQLTVLGTLDAVAGSIDLNLTATNRSYQAAESGSIWLGNQSKLLSQGYFQQSQPDRQNLTQGKVLAGGKININSDGRFVVAQQGSLMDVSGTSADVDLPQLTGSNLVYRRSHVAGDAGSISIKTNEGGFLDGEMKANVEAGSQAAAGKFTLSLQHNPAFKDTNLVDYAPLVSPQLLVMNGGNGDFATQAGLTPGDDTGAGAAALGGLANKFLVDASALKRSGFDQVSLKSESAIVLADQVDLQTRRNLTLDAPELISRGSSTISSAQVTLGSLDAEFQLAPAPVAGSGELNVKAQMIDLSGNFSVSGASLLNMESSGDIRLNGVINNANTALTGSLRTQGNIVLQAAQVYPSTMAQYTLSVEDGSGNAAGSITVQPGGMATEMLLSAGGQLNLSAADIVQNGVVKAPMGTINLNGSNSVTLGTDSLTSVSANGVIIPFGFIEGENTWKYDLTGAGTYFATFTEPPEKQVVLKAPNIDVKSGSTVDLSGGGDLYANEFFAGSGGSINVLDPSNAPANTYAIIPGLSGYSPYDPQASGQYSQSDSRTTLQAGASVYLAGSVELKAGYYTLLPASYALLPGAYKVTAVSGYSDRQPGQGVTTLTDGSQIMAGKFAVVGSNIQDARYSGFRVTPGAVVRTQAEYHDSYANTFFTEQAASKDVAVPRLALDGGQLIISAVGATANLELEGMIKALPATGGRGALVDLDGPGFAIVNTKGAANGLVQLTADTLSNLGANSLLIGGVRTKGTDGMTIVVGAKQVVVDNAGSVLSGAEIILAAKEAVTVKAGSVIEGKGTFTGTVNDIAVGSASVKGDGALLRVSSSAQVGVTRTNLAATAATLTIEDGATVSAENSLLLDSSSVTTVENNAVLNGKSFSVAAQNIDIGSNTASGATSLALNGALLERALKFESLTLHSYNDINFYGAGSLGGRNADQQHILSNLVLDARSLNGFNNAGQTNLIDATNVTLLNSNTGTSAATAYGAGNLEINADQITLAAGDKAIQGFNNVTFVAAKQLVAQGKGSITLNAGDAAQHSLVLQAGQITGTNKSDLTINASNDVITIQPVTGAAASATEALNAKLKIVGKRIVDNGIIDLAAGSVTLQATGTEAGDGVTLGSGSRISATGLSKTISGQTKYAQAGTVSLISENGGVDIQSGALVDVSGDAGGGDAGSLNVTATKGAVAVAGNLKGAANAKHAQGSFTLDANSLAGTTANALTELNDTLTTGSFTTLRDMRVRTGDLVIAADAAGAVRAKAQTIRLTADAGNIDVYGTVDASGSRGGNILLAAKNNLTLNAGALLDAHANDAQQAGGKVDLQTAALGGLIELNNQLIDVHGGTSGGNVSLRAARNATNDDVNLNNTDLTTGNTASSLNVSTGAKVTVEAFITYDYTGATSLTVENAENTTDLYKSDATEFADNAYEIKQRLGMLGDSNLHLTPGVELASSGDLTLATNWDLAGWRFNDGNGGITEPGILTFRAAGNLNFGSGTTQASLTDGFTTANNVITSVKEVFGTMTPTPTPTIDDPLSITNINVPWIATTTDSWSYRLIAGADTGSADVMAVKSTVPATGVPTTGNVVLLAGKEVTGKGTYAYKDTATFTMEQIRTGTGFIDIAAGGNLKLGNRDSVIYTAGRASTVTGLPSASNRHFGENGGDISIRVKGDVIGAATDQLITDWQWRQGTPDLVTAQPAWWINIGSFRQNVGALGGGNVSVVAGGNINNLSAVAPTTGYLDMTTKQAVVLGGGDVTVTAGASINSGVFYVGNGQGMIQAGADLGSTRKIGSESLYTVLALGQGNFDVRAGGELNLQAVVNPTLLAQSYSQIPSGSSTGEKAKNYFSTYGENSGISLSSLSGNVSLNGLGGKTFTNVKYAYTAIPNVGFFYLNTTDTQGATVYPGSITATALAGDIVIKEALSVFPSTNGNLELVAANNIDLLNSITMSDTAASRLGAAAVTSSIGALTQNLRLAHDSVHAQDTQPIILSAGGNIGGSALSPGGLVSPKAVQLEAGQNVQYIGLTVQNMRDTDTSSVVAGKDIYKPSLITVSGPGQVVLQAGRNVDLGSGNGIVTKGNLINTNLPEEGASITVLAGVGQGGTASQAFIDKYIDPAANTTHGDELVSYVRNYGAPQDQTAFEAFTTFSSLSKPLQDAFARQVFFSELRNSGRDAVSTQNYQAGMDAIATLFPSAGYKGDINLYYSQIKTLRGGDINLLTPGGGVNAGLANPPTTVLTKLDSELGIVTGKGGDINAFVNKDFIVNQSRVFTLQGGDILMWAAQGDIDAGKGSKSVSSTPPPVPIINLATGNIELDMTRSVVGSGIAVLLANKDVIPGSVDLIAPNGAVNAGDAGIRSAGDIFLAAARVVGADNISFGGTGAGVPVAPPAPVSVGFNLQDASKVAEEATQSLASVSDMSAKDFKPTFLSVEVIGMGEEESKL